MRRIPLGLVVLVPTALVALFASASAVGGCGSSADTGSVFAESTATSGVGHGGASTGTGGGGIGTDTSSFDAGTGTGTGTDGGTLSPDAACASSSVDGALQPLAMYVLLDRSGSMNQNGATKWNDASDAFGQFVGDPGAAGIKVALSFFPMSNASCDGTGYSTPVVPMGVLPGNAGAVVSAISQHAPGGGGKGTPMEGALNGLRTFCSSYAPANPGDKTVAVLITDGQPNGCDESTSHLAKIASAMVGGSPSVPLFAIGMVGADFNFMDQLAQAGGTTKSFDVSQGGAGAFLAALKAIAGKALPCEFAMPTSDGNKVDPTKVNVTYTDQNAVDHQLGQVANAGACVPNAWYYDDAAAPTKILLCPDTCQAVRAQASGKIHIVLGCATSVAPPPA